MSNCEKKIVRSRAFTLVELLVVIAVIAILTGLAFGAYSAAFISASRTAEISAAKQAITAYHSYASDNNGRLMPGLKEDPVKTADGQRVGSFLAKRWPYRLDRYLDGRWDGVVVVNEALANAQEAGRMNRYVASVFPSLGLNTTYVGGNYNNHHQEPRVTTDRRIAITRMNQAVAPGKLVVFVSASTAYTDEESYGNFYVMAPNSSKAWNDSYDEDAKSNVYGHVHFRFNGQAVAAHLDGSVAALNFEELNDMTRWSNQAAKKGNPDWKPGQ